MTDNDAGHVRKHVRLNVGVFVALLVLTVVTVTASGLTVGIATSIIVAMVIAAVKGSLVGAFFMHLSNERRAIYGVLVLAGVFTASMAGLLMWSSRSPLEGTSRAPMQPAVVQHDAAEEH